MRGVAIGMVAGVALTATAVFGLQAFAPSAEAVGADTYRELNLFGDVFERVRSDYVEPVDEFEADRLGNQRHAHFARSPFELYGCRDL